MAEFFTKFDCLPIEHSHGNLCACAVSWTSTRSPAGRTYLGPGQGQVGRRHERRFRLAAGRRRRALASLLPRRRGVQRVRLAAVQSGPLAIHRPDPLSRCRRATAGEPVRDEPVPQRRLRHGHVDGDSAGPVAAIEKIEEWPFWPEFSWAAGAPLSQRLSGCRQRRGVFVNFPYSLVAPVKAAGRAWSVSVRSKPDDVGGRTSMEIELAPRDKAAAARGRLWVRMPRGLRPPRLSPASGGPLPVPVEGGYLRIERDFKACDKLMVEFQSVLTARRPEVPEGAHVPRRGKSRASRTLPCSPARNCFSLRR